MKVPNVPVAADPIDLPAVDTSCQSMYSFGVVNRGSHAVVAQLEISPDNVHFAEDAKEIVAGGGTVALVPIRYLRYTRVTLRPAQPGEETVVDVHYQAQTWG